MPLPKRFYRRCSTERHRSWSVRSFKLDSFSLDGALDLACSLQVRNSATNRLFGRHATLPCHYFQTSQLISAKLGLPDSTECISPVDVRLSGRSATLLPFQLSRHQAEQAFDAWHKQRLLSPSGLLTGAVGPMRQAYLPFWLFDASVQVQYTGALRH